MVTIMRVRVRGRMEEATRRGADGAPAVQRFRSHAELR